MTKKSLSNLKAISRTMLLILSECKWSSKYKSSKNSISKKCLMKLTGKLMKGFKNWRRRCRWSLIRLSKIFRKPKIQKSRLGECLKEFWGKVCSKARQRLCGIHLIEHHLKHQIEVAGIFHREGQQHDLLHQLITLDHSDNHLIKLKM